MDVKQYYRKIRDTERSFPKSAASMLVVSLETADGGKAGLISEVPRLVAARMIVEGRAVQASDSQRKAYLEQQAAAREAAKKMDMARRVQVAILSDPDLECASFIKDRKDTSNQQ